MTYVIDFGGLKVPVNDIEINRTPSFTFFWGVYTRDLVGTIYDDTKDFFQIRFTAYNIKPLVEKILSSFASGSQISIVTPHASFSDAVIQNATIDNDQISVSLIASEPSGGGHLVESDVCLALEVNYYRSRPGFINFFQFGNYLALSTFPFSLNRWVYDSLGTVFENEFWSVFKLPVSESPRIIKYSVSSLSGYCYTTLPELMTSVLLQPGMGNQYTYVFGVHPSCELAAYLRVEDLQTGEVWYRAGNQGTIELAPGSYRLIPLVVIPETQPKYIYGHEVAVYVPYSQTILSFFSPLTMPLDETLKLYANENLILQFDGWKTIQVSKNSLTEIKFDYPGTFQCHVFSQDRNLQITTFTVNVYDTYIPQTSYEYQIKIDSYLTTPSTAIDTDSDSYLALNTDGAIISKSNQTFVTVVNSITSSQTQIIVDSDEEINVISDMGTLLYSSIDDYQVKAVDVFFHSTPVAGKPVLMSVDGLVSGIEIDDAIVEQISNTLYKLTFNSDGYKAITLYLPNNKTLTKYVSVLPGFRKIVTTSESGQMTCTTGDFWALIRSPTVVKLIPPNTTFSWTEYSLGLTNINVTLIKGSKIADVQYRYMIYNTDTLKIVSYGRTLQLLALPHSEIDQILWYIDNSFIGMGEIVVVPVYISGGTYNVKAVVYSNNKVITVTETVTIPHADINRIQLSCQLIHPHIKPETTNRLVTIYNGAPEVTYQYLDSSLNIRLTKYLYMERFTYVGNVKDLRW